MSRIQGFLNKLQFDIIKILLVITITTVATAKILTLFNIESKIAILAIQQGIIAIPVLLFLITKKSTLIELGIIRTNPVKALLLIVKFYILYIFGAVAISLLTLKFNFSIPGFGTQPDYSNIFEGIHVAGIFILVVILAPVFEELLFRGLIYSKIIGTVKFKIIVNSLLFASIHLQAQIFLPLFALGIIISYIRYKTNSIYPAIIFHSLNNLITFIAIKSTF